MKQTCPSCQSEAFKRNGYTRHGKQNHRCLECGRQFSLEPYVEAEAIITLPELSYNGVLEEANRLNSLDKSYTETS